MINRKDVREYGQDAIDRAADLIAEFEGFSEKAYLCPAGVWTIGFGHTRNVTEGMTIDREEAVKLLRLDVAERKSALESLLRVPVSENQLVALLSFVYNVGVGNFSRSTMLRKLNVGNYSGAAKEFGRWVFVNNQPLRGLMRRRAREKQIFETPSA